MSRRPRPKRRTAPAAAHTTPAAAITIEPAAPPAAAPAAAAKARDPRPWLVGAGVVVAIGALYLRTAAQDIVFGDSPELTGAAITLGVAHPPGYPVWTILGHLFTLLPVGTLPFRVSLFSIVAALVCLALVYATAYRLTRSLAGSATAALLLGLVPTFWIWSIVPEVFALSDALAAALLYLLLRWHLDGRPAFFIAAAFTGGIGLAHHQTIALLGPAVLYLMWQHRRRFEGGGLVLRAALTFGAGLLPYAYLPLAATRHAEWNWGDISSLDDLIGHILRSSYGTGSLVTEARFQGGAVADRLLALGRSFSVAEAILVAIGLVALFRRDRFWGWSIAIGAVFCGPLFIAYTNTNLSIALLQAVLERFFLLAHVVLAPLAAIGVVAAARALADRLPVMRHGTELAVALPAVALAVALAVTQLPSIDQSEDRTARTFGEDILSAVRPNAILLAGGDGVIGPVGYLRAIEGARPDLTFIQMPLLRADWYVRELHRRYPALALKYQKFDGRPGTLRGFIEPNDVQRFDIIGSLIDDSLLGTYGLYRRGLVEELRPRDSAVDLAALATETDAALRSYRIPNPASVAMRPWDRLILGDYGMIAYDVGGIFERSKRYAEARDWYLRALVIDPDLVEARTALARLPK